MHIIGSMKSIGSTGNVKSLTIDMKDNRSIQIEYKPDSKKMTVCYRLAQWTWGLPQTLCGAAVYLRYRKNPHETYHGASVTVWPHKSSVSLGMYIFVSDHLISKQRRNNSAKRFTEDSFARRILMHEYGHTIQSLMTGPLYLILIGLPSFIWNQTPAFERLRDRKRISYYSVYPEKQADKLGTWYLHKKQPESSSDHKTTE